MRRAVAIVGLALLVLVAAGSGSNSSKSSGSTSESAGSTSESSGEGGSKVIAGLKANDHGAKSVSDEAEVELDDFYFEPTVLQGTPGHKVTLELKNEGKVEHNFTLAAQGIDKDVEPGEDAKVSVTIPKSGAVSFYCKYHKSSGMAGALAVTGQSNGQSGGGGMTDTSGGGGKGY